MDVNKQMCVPFPLLAHQVILVFDFAPIAALNGSQRATEAAADASGYVAFLTPEINGC